MHETRPGADKTADKTSDAQLGKTLQHRFLKHTEFPEMHRQVRAGFPVSLWNRRYGTSEARRIVRIPRAVVSRHLRIWTQRPGQNLACISHHSPCRDDLIWR